MAVDYAFATVAGDDKSEDYAIEETTFVLCVLLFFELLLLRYEDFFLLTMRQSPQRGMYIGVLPKLTLESQLTTLNYVL